MPAPTTLDTPTAGTATPCGEAPALCGRMGDSPSIGSSDTSDPPNVAVDGAWKAAIVVVKPTRKSQDLRLITY